MTKDKYMYACFGFKNSFSFVSLVLQKCGHSLYFSHKIVAKNISVGCQMFWCRYHVARNLLRALNFRFFVCLFVCFAICKNEKKSRKTKFQPKFTTVEKLYKQTSREKSRCDLFASSLSFRSKT